MYKFSFAYEVILKEIQPKLSLSNSSGSDQIDGNGHDDWIQDTSHGGVSSSEPQRHRRAAVGGS